VSDPVYNVLISVHRKLGAVYPRRIHSQQRRSWTLQSGAQFNPAVSCVFALRGELKWSMTIVYVAAQVAGAVVGVLAAHAMFDLPLSEGVATFGLVLTILGCRRYANQAVP
jgi:glycerol uptake facilitator-like aquaporin